MYFRTLKIKKSLAIFLDVDGVLNKESDWQTPFSLNNGCVSTFSKLWTELSKKYCLSLVLISSWRSGKSKYGNTDAYDHLEAALKQYGIKINDTTPLSNKGRQNEVNYYIRRNNIDQYIVIDDDESLYDDPTKINLYRPNYKTGLVDSDVKKIIREVNYSDL